MYHNNIFVSFPSTSAFILTACNTSRCSPTCTVNRGNQYLPASVLAHQHSRPTLTHNHSGPIWLPERSQGSSVINSSFSLRLPPQHHSQTTACCRLNGSFWSLDIQDLSLECRCWLILVADFGTLAAVVNIYQPRARVSRVNKLRDENGDDVLRCSITNQHNSAYTSVTDAHT